MSFNVLLVDPDPGLAEEIRRAFEPVGFSVTAVPGGEAALQRCREAPPELILLAAELPDMSGFSVCNRLKRALPAVPLILYSGEATEAAIEAHRATRTRADDYLRRPFELADLLGRAAGLLNAAPPAPAPAAAAPPPPPPPRRRREEPAEPPPVLSRVDSGAVAARGLAAAMAAAQPAPAPRPAPPAPRAAPPVPPPVPPAPRPQAAIGRVQVRGDATDVLSEWPRDPAPPKGTPEEKLEYFRDRLRARDAFLPKLRDAISQLRAETAELGGERDALQSDLDAVRARVAELEHRLAEAAQDAAAQGARIEDLRRQLEDGENTRRSLSEVLNETMQQHEASEQQWSARVAGAEEARARLEAELTDAREGHA
ncbi:MAG TPA: response regulator, partial [Anaeromyxobacter sp.]|nr:response regulator [Anaeromyxobacter sp.]